MLRLISTSRRCLSAFLHRAMLQPMLFLLRLVVGVCVAVTVVTTLGVFQRRLL
jgi:hypothetical protein